MKDLLAGTAYAGFLALLLAGLAQDAKPGTIAPTAPSQAACIACQEYAGTDYCECLAHPLACQAEDPALYRELHQDSGEKP